MGDGHESNGHESNGYESNGQCLHDGWLLATTHNHDKRHRLLSTDAAVIKARVAARQAVVPATRDNCGVAASDGDRQEFGTHCGDGEEGDAAGGCHI